MATIKYKDADGNLVTVGAGLHTHSPSSIGAADRVHGHDAATADNDGFLSSTDKTKIDNLNDTVFGNADKNITSLVDLVGESPVQEQISSAVADRVVNVPGKGLSTEDYTTAEKTKLANIEQYANNYELPTAAKDVIGGVTTTSTVTSKSNHTACPIIDGIPYYKDTNTKNTAGASNTSSKIYLIGATAQSANPTTYSHDTAYVDADGCLYSNSTKVSIEGHTHTVDSTLSSTSTNPIQNKVVYAIDQKVGETPVSEQINGAITAASTVIKSAANTYTDNKISALINGAPSTLDTLGEIATAMAANANVVDALDKAIGGKAEKDHKHITDDITDLDTELAAKVPTTRTVNGKALSADISLTYSDVGAAQSSHDHDGRYYTETEVDNKFNTLVGNDPVSEQISDHADDMASTTAPGHMSKEDKIKLDGLENYVHPTTAGNKHIPSGGSTGQILRYSSSGTAKWDDENNTTYSNATASKAGLMSETDKEKLDSMFTHIKVFEASNSTSDLIAQYQENGGYPLTIDRAGDITLAADFNNSKLTIGTKYIIDVKRDSNYVPPSNTADNIITIVLPS